MIRPFIVLASVDSQGGIAANGKIPWSLAKDQLNFKMLTTTIVGEVDDISGYKNVLIMGRKTYDSLPQRPLPDRHNIVITRDTKRTFEDGVIKAGSLDEALVAATNLKNSGHVFVIGGGDIYSEAVKHELCHCLYLTEIDQDFGCDIFFPEIPLETSPFLCLGREDHEESGIKFAFKIYGKLDATKRMLKVIKT